MDAKGGRARGGPDRGIQGAKKTRSLIPLATPDRADTRSRSSWVQDDGFGDHGWRGPRNGRASRGGDEDWVNVARDGLTRRPSRRRTRGSVITDVRGRGREDGGKTGGGHGHEEVAPVMSDAWNERDGRSGSGKRPSDDRGDGQNKSKRDSRGLLREKYGKRRKECWKRRVPAVDNPGRQEGDTRRAGPEGQGVASGTG